MNVGRKTDFLRFFLHREKKREKKNGHRLLTKRRNFLEHTISQIQNK